MLEAMFLSTLVGPLSATLHGSDVAFDSVSIDARRVLAGGLFVALAGSRVDGHDFIAQARANGAAAAMVERLVEDPLPQLLVADCQAALGQLGALNRAGFRQPLVAITGSSGKTTVKEMLAAILRQCGAVLATRGNLNNELGVPLTLLELSHKHQYAVVEMGAGAIGDISYSMGLARPDVSVLTNAGVAHIGRFGSEQAIAQAKGEIFAGLGEAGQAVVNLDSPWLEDWRALIGSRRTWSFSLTNPAASLRAAHIRLDERGCPAFLLHSPIGEIEIQLNLLGEHNVANALAAAAAALALGVSLKAIQAGLAALQPVAGRGKTLAGRHGAHIIDDCYNANPASVRAAIDVLAALTGRRVLVLGDMGELGDSEQQAHREIGEYARDRGLDALYATGPLSALAAEAFGAEGRSFDSRSALAAALKTELDPSVRVLVKGSRSAGMEEVVAALVEGSQNKDEGKPTCC
ncbi:UDP-N-acetylmuramoyl-tripeptide--D-alanyl-D-alanine ligase [Halopseudomonas pertucinogena]|uniref:UDP-N-acetylmuramoyl-tripeptide--D-alanyl-D-alanine ligase n=1 Tax=Halopseudomonas pertucinogena TaxID=86175 RepID=A0ABQ2CS44_9GAMM|nr:UDP-N-acetylmuramoyl-tripeptide--D-alanyl-D-alanine ligase [Halopseudomonas pertucinogena]GGJ00701.1 UDP-N-acetylmuramoyl-tripeptide--D-alanyl-D-alanine ligase [Halopseudomonas pertucinogena]